jgi:hypothetical protein
MPHCSNCGGKLPEKDIIAYSGANPLDSALTKEVEKISISEYSGVRFIPTNGTAFTSNRENIVKITAMMIQKLGKTSFEPNEFSPYLEKITEHVVVGNIKEIELNRVLGKIKSWVKSGGSVVLMKK